MIIITGASGGIGSYLFERYKKSGSEVLGTYHTTKINFNNNDSLFQVDISNFSDVSSWLKRIEDKLDQIVLINCAGINYNSFAHKAEIEKWERVIKVNLVGTFNVIRCLLPYMREQNFGRIINFSSVTTVISTPGISAYAASKAGLLGMTKSLAIENGSKGITINNINLGYADIGMGIKDVPYDYATLIRNRIPSKEFCSPDDIFSTVNYIVSTKYINGSNIYLNGGIS